MNKLFTKIVGACLGLTMAVGVGVAVAGGSKEASPVHATTTTYRHVFNAKPSTGSNVTLSSVNWTVSATNLGNYNSANYAGVQVGTSSKSSDFEMTSSSNWGAESGTYKDKTVVTEIRLWLNAGATGTISTLTASVGGAACTPDKTSITKNSSAGSDYTKATKITFTIGSTNKGVVDIHFGNSSSRALYVCCVEIDCEEPASDYVGSLSVSPSTWVGYDSQTLSVSSFTVSGSKNGTAGAVTSSDYEFQGIGYMSSGNFVARVADFSSGKPTTADTRLAWKAKYPTTAGGSTYAWAYVTLTVSADGVNSIAISGSMTKTTYNQGDAWDPAGFTVKAYYASAPSTPVDVTSNANLSWTYSPATTASTSTTSVTCTASFGGKSATSSAQSVTVNEKVIDHYELIKSTDDLTAGSSYLIGNVTGTAFMSTTQNGNNRGKQDPGTAASDDVVEYTEGFEVLTLGGKEDEWTFYATNPEGNASGSEGYLYAASSGSNYLRTQAENNANGEWSIDISSETGGATILAQGTNTRNKMRYNGSNNPPIFSCYASDASTGSEPALWKKIDTSENIALSKASVSDMKGNTNHEVSITATNFTPTTISATYSVANIASITAGTISDGIIPLNIACNGVGSTVATITVNGGKDTHAIDLSITVTQKPASLTLVNSDIKNGEIEVKHGGSKQVSFTALDTDEGDYSINYSGITASSSNANVTLSGNVNMVLNGSAVGDATVTCTITATAGWQTPITQTLIVHVVDDYNEKNVAISVTNDVSVDQGDTLVIAKHISSATATTHFGTNNNPILNDELIFSYTNNRSAAVAASNFVWDVTDPNLDEGDTETRTVYVFVTFNESYAGTSFTAVVTVESRPVVGLLVDGVEKSNNDTVALSLPRNSTYDFNSHVAVNPVNATESHDIIYTLTSGGSYVSLSNGVMTIGSKIGSSVATITAKPYAKQDFSITFSLTITREAMTIKADMPVSFTKVTSTSELTDGEYAIVYESGTSSYAFDGDSFTDAAGNYVAASIEDDVLAPSDALKAATVWITNTENGYTIQSHDKTKYITGKGSANNGSVIGTSPSYNTITFGTESSATVALIADSVGNVFRMNPNSGNPWFRFYKSATYTGQSAVQLYKLAGGLKDVTVTDALFNVVNAAMSLKEGSSTLYDLGLCNASGTSFNVSAWNTLGSSFTSSIISDNKLAYARADENGNEIEQFLAVYDYVIGKKESGYAAYASANDFLGRVESGKISASASVKPLVNIVGNSNTVAIIVVISMISVTAVGGYFLLRRRKEVK